jgi:DnaK suppressor protein
MNRLIINIADMKTIVENKKGGYPQEVLKEFETLITDKIQTAEKEYNELARKLKAIQEDSSFEAVKEDISDNVVFDEIKILAMRLQTYITHLSYALMRIANGTYGVCAITGKLIPVERLRAVPTATKCIEAK